MHAQGVILRHRHEQLAVVVQLVERQVTSRDGAFEDEALGVTASGQHAAVQRRLRPADRCLEVEEAIALFFHEVENLIDGIATGIQIVLLHGQPEGQTRGLADRVADVDTGTQAIHRVAGDVIVQLVVVGGAIEGVVAQADAIFGPVGVDEAKVVARLVLAAGQAQRDTVTGTKEVVLTDGTAKDQAGVLREADTGHDRAGRLLLDAIVDVDLVVGTRHLRRFDVDFLEEAQALEASLGLVDQVGRCPAALHLAHLAAQHLIFGLGVATEVDAIDIGTLARIDDEGDRDGVVLVVRFRDTIDVGEGIALVAKATGDQLGRRGHHLAGEHLAFLRQEQRLDLFLRNLEITAELDVANGVTLAFVDVDRHIDVLLVRRDGYLGRGDIHVDVATVQVIGTQAFQVAGQLLAGVLVVVAEEGKPVGGLQLEQVDQILVREHRVAHDVDVLDGSDRAFVDLDLQRDAIARLGNHFGFDGGRVTTLGDILTLQLVAHAFERRTLEDLAFGEP